MPKESKNKKENKHFFKDFKAELKKVIWPTPKQLVNNTVAVVTIVLVTAVIVFVLDFVFEGVNNFGINKLKSIVKTDEIVNEETINENEVEATTTDANNEGETQTSEEVSQ